MNCGVLRPRPALAAAYAVFGVAAAAAYLLTPSAVVAGSAIVALYVSALVAVVFGISRNRPRDRSPWLLLAATLLVWIVAWGFWEARIVATGAPPAPESLVNVLFLIGYPTLAAALVALIARREPDAVALIDVGIVATALFAPLWVVVISGYVGDEALSPFARAVQVGYGVVDVAVLAVALRLVVSTGPRTRSFHALVGGAVLFVFSDVVWNWSTRLHSYTPGTWADVGWLLFPVLVGVAALAPSMVSLYDQLPRCERRLRAGRVLVLVVASAVAPALLVIAALRGDAEIHETIVVGLAALAIALLVVGELALLLRDQGRLADALERRTERLRHLAQTVEATHDAVAAMTPDGIVTAWNPGAEQLFGYRADEMVGTSILRLTPESSTADQAERIERVRRGAAAETYDAVRRAKDGRLVEVSVTLSAIRDDEGHVAGLAAIARDVSEQKRLEAERERLLAAEREQNEQLRELDKLKDEFVSLVSHELRTPLTSIRGYLELVLDREVGELTDGQRKFLEVVDRNAVRLLHLVSDLLFLAQLDAGKLALDRRPVDLAGLAAESIEAARPAADSKGVALECVMEPLPELVADPARLAQVLDNLVSNAVKFTPAGGAVRLRVLEVEGYARVEVSDTGIGIPPAEQHHLFERFFRSSVSTERAIQGTGLGLAIAKAIVEAHGGRIRVESDLGAGTTFYLDLPAAQPAEAPAPAFEQDTVEVR